MPCQVVSVSEELKVLDVATIERIKKPKQMVWCRAPQVAPLWFASRGGDDCIALYLIAPSDHNSGSSSLILL